MVPVVEAQLPKCVRSTSTPFASSIYPVRPIVRNVTSAPLVLSRNTTRWYSSNLPGPLKHVGNIGSLFSHLVESSKISMRKIYAPPGSPFTTRVLAGLNRFGPLMLVNPMFMWNLQTAYRPYLTMGIALLSGLLFLSSTIGTPDSTMRLVAVPMRYWAGDETRLLTSPFVHTHLFHFTSLSGFLLAFSTAVEVAAGPLALLAVLLSTAVVGTAAAICAPERSNKYVFDAKIPFYLFFSRPNNTESDLNSNLCITVSTSSVYKWVSGLPSLDSPPSSTTESRKLHLRM